MTLRGLVRLPIAWLGLLAVAFVVYTEVVGTGALDRLDRALAQAMAAVWLPALLPLGRAVAVLGGIEASVALTLVLGAVMWRRGFRTEALVLLALPLAEGLEGLYKRLMVHPAPTAFSHPDGPSLVTMLERGTLNFGGSYPSGHMIRTVLLYGLGAFIVRRLAAPRWATTSAVPVAAVVVGLMALDRVYLGVHWQSDVVGGLLLGGALLAGAIAWLDRPRAVAV